MSMENLLTSQERAMSVESHCCVEVVSLSFLIKSLYLFILWFSQCWYGYLRLWCPVSDSCRLTLQPDLLCLGTGWSGMCWTCKATLPFLEASSLEVFQILWIPFWGKKKSKRKRENICRKGEAYLSLWFCQACSDVTWLQVDVIVLRKKRNITAFKEVGKYMFMISSHSSSLTFFFSLVAVSQQSSSFMLFWFFSFWRRQISSCWLHLSLDVCGILLKDEVD